MIMKPLELEVAYETNSHHHLVGGIPTPTYPIYNWGYNPLTKWDEPPSIPQNKPFEWENDHKPVELEVAYFETMDLS